jgi:hypothetical protein
MLITYYPAMGKEMELEAALAHAWQVYQSEHLVYDRPHIIVHDAEAGEETHYVEIFTWKKSPDNPSAAVSEVWKQEQELCEARNGHKGIVGGPVQMVKGE